MNDKTKFYVIESGECPECHGDGYNGSRLYCGICGEDQAPDACMPWASKTLSCGHDVSALREDETICSECEGEGAIRREITLEEALKKLGVLR